MEPNTPTEAPLSEDLAAERADAQEEMAIVREILREDAEILEALASR